jgi:hypothetical protein
MFFTKQCKEGNYMEQDDISVRKLARLAGISPTIVQAIRSGTKTCSRL